MSDTPTPDPATTGSPTDAAPAGDTAPAAPDSAAPPPAPAPWEGKTPEELYARNGELMKENASYRQKYQPFEQAFGSMADTDQRFFLEFFGALQSGDQARIGPYASALREALDGLSPAQKQAVAEGIDAAQQQGEEFDPFKPENIDARVQKQLDDRFAAMDQQRQQQQAQAEAGAKIAAKAKEVAESSGIAEFADPNTAEGRLLLLTAFNDFPDEPDPMARIDRAAEKIQMVLAERGQQLLKAKTADAGPSPVPPGGVEPPGPGAPTTFADARKSADERIRLAFSEPVGT